MEMRKLGIIATLLITLVRRCLSGLVDIRIHYDLTGKCMRLG